MGRAHPRACAATRPMRCRRFEPTPLYGGGRSTYIYGAAIQDLKRHGVVGGIAIVFDARRSLAPC